MSQISSKYGVALFELAKEENKIDYWKAQVKLVKHIFNQEKQLKILLNHYNISNEEKKVIINNIFKENIDKYLLNFICILIDKKRISLIEEVCTDFISLCNKYSGIEEGIVYSIKLLDDKTLDEIEKALSKKYGKRIELINKIDLNLISGIKVVINDEVIDGSIRTRIENLKEELLEKAGKIL